MPSSTPKSKPKASEVAADTRRNYIPLIRNTYAHIYKTYSHLFPQPLTDLQLHGLGRPYERMPTFYVKSGDPVMMAVEWATHLQSQYGEAAPVPFICSANDKRPGGDWETGVSGCEERLCRRSTLSATLATPAPESGYQTNYPIPIEGGILSEDVVVFRGPHDRYDKLPPQAWGVLPVCSVPPVRWPKLTPSGTQYSFAEERAMVKNKLHAALRICVYHGYTNLVVGDFGLGNGYRNPPQAMAELWREGLLWDADLRGRIQAVAFVFEDPSQSTTRLIRDALSKKKATTATTTTKHSSGAGAGGHEKSRGVAGVPAKTTGYGSLSSPASSSSSSPASVSPFSAALPHDSGSASTDMDIFKFVFSKEEINRTLTQPDPRYRLDSLMSPM
ncbi:hypothetical protein SPI_02060 [Niveomyces insectorum RCEF 264]|uniref:Microbial-type PARG catalytic domain-containing protein n=1 Tax=Niveomyces insectorum RCEF 264 TaxID=1081102 RepID=A0A167XQR0_9HYPO|nr:hypothetical protein SPI_02060 [Niveomyces insectorum RCEF 264]